jgi:hypothetical protein
MKLYSVITIFLFSLSNVGSTINLPPTYLTTPKGNVFKFRTNEGIFQLQWFQKGKWKHCEYKFIVNGPEAHKPKFIAENDKYVLLRAGCGNPCWIDLFFPLNEGATATIINEYLAYDLNQDYVVSINNDNKLQVYNLKTHQFETIKTPKCESDFSPYCVDTIYFQKKQLKFKWKTKLNSNKGQWYKFKISI